MAGTMKSVLLVYALVTCVRADGDHHHAAPPVAITGAEQNSHYAIYYHEDQAAPPEQVVSAAAPHPAAPIQAAPLLDPMSSYMSYETREDYPDYPDYPEEPLLDGTGTKGGVDPYAGGLDFSPAGVKSKLTDVNTWLKIFFLVVLALAVSPYIISWFGIIPNLGRTIENIPYDDIMYYGDLVFKAISKTY
ncbi:unnamed protein product [Meganyctiphanes norvegica]|uniref:Uncharacterized protein n=1 Tax=Meganyctiphanes norvegica TaxID=48144 RepID=A0AAV2SCR6_MEGNR